MNYIIKKSLKVSLIDAIVVSIFAFLSRVMVDGFFFLRDIFFLLFSVVLFLLLFLLFFISSLIIAKSSKKEPISIFLYPFSKTDELATLKKPFILSLIACIVLPMGPFDMEGWFVFLIGFSIMRAGLIFMMRPETSTRGGIILLTIGTIGMLSLIIMVETIIAFFLAMLSCVVIIISGFLGIREGSKYYTNELLKMKDEKGEIEKIKSLDAPLIISKKPSISMVESKIPFILSLVGCAGLFFSFLRLALVEEDIFLIVGLIIGLPVAIAGLVFIRKSKTFLKVMR